MSEQVLPIKECKPGEMLIREGRIGKEMYILLKGKVEVSVDGVVITVIDTRGSFIGEICALLGTRRIATVKALEPCKFYVIDNLSEYFAANPESGFMMAKNLAARLIDMNHSFLALKKTLLQLESYEEKTNQTQIKKAIHSIEKSMVDDVIPANP